MIYLELFWVYFQVGLFSFGGGYAAMPIIQNLVVQQKAWIDMAQFADLATIAEMTPGPIAPNSATFVGWKMAGLPGALIATFGCILPSILIVLILAYLYTKFRELPVVKNVLGELRPAVVAMIAAAAVTLVLLALFGTSTLSQISFSSLRWIELGLYILSLILIRKFKWGPIPILILTASAGTILYLII